LTADEARKKVNDGWHELDSLTRSLDAEGLSLHRSPDGWAVKDHLVHIAAWELWLLALFEHRDKLAAMGAGGAEREIDDINTVVYENHRDDSVEEALRYFRESHAQLMRALEDKSTEDFERPYKAFFDPGQESDEQPVLVAVAANTYEHYAEHAGWIKEQIG
jgi:hypothetical protein